MMKHMFYIVGLGNPGEKYKDTRHNVGFAVLDFLREEGNMPQPVSSSKYSGEVSEGVLDDREVILLYPSTFMNNSGAAVRKLVSKGEEKNLILIYDDVDLPIGEFKLSIGRGTGGHNGIESVINALGTKEFVRLRVGVASRSFWTGNARRPAAAALSRHVLGHFTKREAKQLEEMKGSVIAAVECVLASGVETAMNKFN